MYNGKEPVVFVTGIGQTWSTLKNGGDYCWNLVPRKKEIAFKDFNLKMYFRTAGVILRSFLTLTTSSDFTNSESVRDLFTALLSCCVVDENDNLPDSVDVRIYGARSFTEMRNVDLITGEHCDDFEKSMLSRIYHDIPCKELADKIGEDNLYCFNYSPFSDIYSDAQALHETIKEIIAKRKDCEKVILVPMSMGASVVNAYIDKYYSDEKGALDGDYISKIVSMVGAWNGSDGLSDLITFNISDDFTDRLTALLDDKYSKHLSKFREKQIEKVFGSLIDGVVHSVILRNTSFMALVSKERYEEVIEKLFKNTNNKKLLSVKEKSAQYHNAQCNLIKRLETLRDKCSVGIYFICGYNKKFGEDSRDFDFLSLFDSARKTNSDSVIQISSTAPGAKYALNGELFEKGGKYVSPDGNVDVSESPFRDTIWLFDGQYHEIGDNNTAIRLAGDIVLGNVENINDKYPQFNKSRNVRGVDGLLETARDICDNVKLPALKRLAVENAISKVEEMLDNVFNDPQYDNEVVMNLRNEISTVLK